MRKSVLLLIGLFSAFMFSGCNKEPDTEVSKVSKELKVEAGNVKKFDVNVDSDDFTLDENVNIFAFEMYDKISEDNDKYFFSPFSLYSSLSLLSNCASGETKSQIENGLLIEDIHKSNEQIGCFMNTEQSGDTILNCANSVWLSVDLKMNDEITTGFLPVAKDYYKASVFTGDFKNEPDKVKDDINNWITDNTNQMIKGTKDKVNPETAMELINAIYFEGKWEMTFDKEDTREQEFYGLHNTSQIEMMASYNQNYRYYDNGNLRGLSIPYNDGKTVMNVVMAYEDSNKKVSEIYSQMTNEEKAQFLTNLNTANQESINRLMLPKFDFEYKVMELESKLVGLGMTDMFDPNKADFSMLGDASVSEISHVAKIEVDEEGSRAAAVTDIVIQNDSCGPVTDVLNFDVNQPFIFFIQDTETGIILFMGGIDDFE